MLKNQDFSLHKLILSKQNPIFILMQYADLPAYCINKKFERIFLSNLHRSEGCF